MSIAVLEKESESMAFIERARELVPAFEQTYYAARNREIITVLTRSG